MPIEIKELIIKAIVSDEATGKNGSSSSSQDVNSQEALIAQCVEQVLEILKEKQER